MSMRILHYDHAAYFRRDRDAILAAIERVLERGNPIMGPEVAEFEAAFAALCGVAHAVGTMSGTSAMLLGLKALGVGPGDDVVTVANSDIPTTHAILHAGARPVYADVDPDTFLLDPAALERALTPRTKVVLPVHLYGVVADMDAIGAVARAHGAKVLEDAYLATGASYRGRMAGALGDVGAFSTAPGKMLGGIGSGGVVTTDDDEVHERLGQLRYYGRAKSPYPGAERDVAALPGATVQVGYNERLDTVDAAVLLIRLKRLEGDIAARRARRARYVEHFAGSAVAPQAETPGSASVWRVAVVRVPDRDRVYQTLRRQGIEVTLPYLPANHLDVCTRDLGYRRGDLPATEAFCDEMLALPCHPFLTLEAIDEVAEAVLAAVRAHTSSATVRRG
jgi:dTDP-3-amino-2,3,6-trideoxy-4-keto-D-glucose/dTDP-3-amino-3,4,6-trideoxy-alpha-D-glucose/dTDP-2,6-dideoxy-D-kanosamine transaminase